MKQGRYKLIVLSSHSAWILTGVRNSPCGGLRQRRGQGHKSHGWRRTIAGQSKVILAAARRVHFHQRRWQAWRQRHLTHTAIIAARGRWTAAAGAGDSLVALVFAPAEGHLAAADCQLVETFLCRHFSVAALGEGHECNCVEKK